MVLVPGGGKLLDDIMSNNMVTWDGVEEEGCCTQYMVHHHTRDMAKPRMELAPH